MAPKNGGASYKYKYNNVVGSGGSFLGGGGWWLLVVGSGEMLVGSGEL